jgi:hypothetical protein
VYRYMAKKESLTIVEEEMFTFLRKSFHNSRKEMEQALLLLLEKITKLQRDRYQTRTFAYLDIISWLEAKVNRISMSEILETKYQQSRHKIK